MRRARTIPPLPARLFPVLGAVVLVVPACGTTDQASSETLPPIQTTTSTTSTSTTIPNDRFYTIERGDTLAVIAARYQVTVESIVELNRLADPNDIQAGQTIEIPPNVRQQGSTTTRGGRRNRSSGTAAD